MLNAPITFEELTDALKGSKRNVSPGSDGLTTEFYIFWWRKVGKLLYKAIVDGLHKGRLFESALRGIVVTLPKKMKDTRLLKSVRPVTLLPTDYKLLEKVLANRIKPCLEEIIKHDQKGFMAGRKISANIRCVLDIMRMLENEEQEGIVMSVDFEKCFDRIETESLLGAMKCFGMGSKIVEWTKTMYTGATIRVINSGHLTDPVKVTRGCRQGAPCSPYYFLICAELLAIQLRNNKNISGFSVQGFKKLFVQYADDMDLYCKPNQQNVNEILQTLSAFCMSTGCKINYDKTTLYRIGKDNGALAHIYTKGMKVETTTIDILGVSISNNPNEMLHLNYDSLVLKTKTVLTTWENRNLDLLSKITVINSLISSLFIYKMTVLPAIPEGTVKKLNKIVENYIWNGRRPKVPLKKLQNSIYAGGANLVNFSVKDDALKVSWIPYVLSDTDPFMRAVAHKFTHEVLGDYVWECNISEKDIKKYWVKDNFWSGVWIAWSKIHFTNEVNRKQLLWLNSNVRIDKKPFMWKKPFKKGLIYISQLFEGNAFISERVAKDQFELDIMQFNSLRKVLHLYKKASEQVTETKQTQIFKQFCITKKPGSFYYKRMMSDMNLQYNTYIMWNVRIKPVMDYNYFLKLFRNVRMITNYNKLRSFQYRLLQLSLVLNTQLKKWNITDTELCTYCNEYTETIEHIFFECTNAQKLLSEVNRITNYYHKTANNYDLNVKNVIFNDIEENPLALVNFIVLVIKSTIYTNRCLNKRCSVKEIEEKVEMFRKCELYNAKRTGKNKIYYKKWYNLVETPSWDTTETIAREYLTDITLELDEM